MAAAQYSEQTGDAREMAQPLSRSVTILIRRIRRDPRRPCFAVVMLRTRNGYIPIRVVVATGRLHVWMTTAPTRISEDVRSCGIWRMCPLQAVNASESRRRHNLRTSGLKYRDRTSRTA